MRIGHLINYLLPGRVRRMEMATWKARGYAAPSPPHIKRTVLLRLGLPEAVWVETGTYVGDTTAFLAEQAKQVYSIEPGPDLYEQARRRFARTKNVEVIFGTSEQVLPELLERLSGDVSFWLDGHYSAGLTFQGEKDTPIKEELAAIAKALPRLGKVVILVDDVRCFDPADPVFAGYPTRDWLVQWACSQGLRWHIEHDIFAMRNY